MLIIKADPVTVGIKCDASHNIVLNSDTVTSITCPEGNQKRLS